MGIIFLFVDLRSSSSSFDVTSFQRSSSAASGKPGAPSRKQSLSETEFVNRLNAGRSMSSHATPFLLGDLQTATANFASGRLIGHGTIGRVYRAKYTDGKVFFFFHLVFKFSSFF